MGEGRKEEGESCSLFESDRRTLECSFHFTMGLATHTSNDRPRHLEIGWGVKAKLGHLKALNVPLEKARADR